MNRIIRITALSALVATSMQMHGMEELKKPMQGLKPFLKSFACSVLPSAAIGAVSAVGCQLFEQKFVNPDNVNFVAPGNNSARAKGIRLGRLATWFVFCLARNSLLAAVAKTMSSHGIEHNKALMTATGWATDWMVYLLRSNRTAQN